MKFGQSSAQPMKEDLQVKLHVTMREETFHCSWKKAQTC